MPRRKDPRNSGKPKKPDPPSKDPERFRQRPDNYDDYEHVDNLVNTEFQRRQGDRNLKDALEAKRLREEKAAKDFADRVEAAKQDRLREQQARDKHAAEVAQRIRDEQERRRRDR